MDKDLSIFQAHATCLSRASITSIAKNSRTMSLVDSGARGSEGYRNDVATFERFYRDQLASVPPGAGTEVQAWALDFFGTVKEAIVYLDSANYGGVDPLSAQAAQTGGLARLDDAGSLLLRIDGMQAFLDTCHPNVIFKRWRDGMLFPVLPGEVGKYVPPVYCSDFPTHADAQRFFEAAGDGDPHHLDIDRDGIACL